MEIPVSTDHKYLPKEPDDRMLEHALTAVKAANISVKGKLDSAEATERVLLRAAWMAMHDAAALTQSEAVSKASKRMNEILSKSPSSSGQVHIDADEVLCDLLTDLGYGEIVAAYNKIEPKWYE